MTAHIRKVCDRRRVNVQRIIDRDLV